MIARTQRAVIFKFGNHPKGHYLKMKATDIGGAVAVVLAGYIVGRDVERGDMDFSSPSTLMSTDGFFVLALLGLGYYLAVYLS